MNLPFNPFLEKTDVDIQKKSEYDKTIKLIPCLIYVHFGGID